MTCEEVVPLLSAYHDDALNDGQRGQVERHLPGCELCKDELSRYRLLSRAIRIDAPNFSAPASLRHAVANIGPKAIPARRRERGWFPFSVGLACGLALATMVLLTRPAPTGMSVASVLVDDHVRSLMANHLIDVPSSDRHTVKPWFLGKVDFAPTVLDLASDGFPLKGGRLDYIGGHTAAVLVYGCGKHVVNVYVQSGVVADDGATELRGYHLVRWSLGDLSYTAVSDAGGEDLKTFARIFQARAK